MSTLTPMPPAPTAAPAPAVPPPTPKRDVTKIVLGVVAGLALLIGALAVFIPMMSNDEPSNTVVITQPAPESPPQATDPTQAAEPTGPSDATLAANAVIRYMPDYLTNSQMNQYCSLAVQAGPKIAATTTNGNPGTLGYRIEQTADKYGVTTEALFAAYIRVC